MTEYNTAVPLGESAFAVVEGGSDDAYIIIPTGPRGAGSEGGTLIGLDDVDPAGIDDDSFIVYDEGTETFVFKTPSQTRTILKTPKSDSTGISGADVVSNMVVLSQAEYDNITPDATTIYYIV